MALLVKQSFQHNQDNPASTWLIVHNLDRDVICDCSIYVDGTLQKILPKSIELVDMNTVKVSFSTAFKGKARIA